MIRKVAYEALNYFYPILCGICGREDFFSRHSGLCKECANLAKDTLKYPKCPVCSWKIEAGQCSYCLSRNVFFTRAFFLHERTDLLAEALNKIKKQSAYPLSLFLSLGARKVLRNFKNVGLQAYLLLPSSSPPWFGTVPTRPFSPMRELLLRTEETLNLSCIHPLKKMGKTRQAGKSYADRFFHARNSWAIREEWIGKCPKKVLILDDVFTTGASVNEASRILRENGSEEIYVLTYLRTME
ncbi:phosphoribosyl transferase domain protein [Leptospira broomii serovar Hurstbridge str. 5399]|uniref:Phosphoribosyl transferase domain protein n=1 Tax=Leptospira broomii serovar Hurstbridge str. 5399 TaxID=1049789 RepID=T0F1D8_9LEPT|nr:ComF family protein [Leptospira broomii]EQA44955.1 phosphoribosyl transferase domain protein [Leptospira broomii serovar Hurstbridge str. 5399]